MEAFSRREGVTLFITLLSAFAVLLHRFCRQDEMVIGTPIANRTAQELEPIIGFFLNTLPLRSRSSWPAHVPCAAATHQDGRIFRLCPPGAALREAGRRAEAGSKPVRADPIIDTVFVLDNNPGAVGSTERVGDLILRRRVIDTGTCEFDLGLLLFRRDGGRRATLEYRTDLFKPATAAGLLQRYRRLLDSILADPDATIDRLALADERRDGACPPRFERSATPRIRADKRRTAVRARSRACPGAHSPSSMTTGS